MGEEILNAINQIRANTDLNTYDEAMTKQAVILRLLAAIGWNHFHPDEVRAEYATFGRRVDYSLRIDGINKVFIEVKQTCVALDLHEEQLLRYAFQEGVKLAVLTNGVTWQFYLPLHEGTWTDRKYYTADLKQQAPAVFAEKLAQYLSRHGVQSGEAVRHAEDTLLSAKRSIMVEAAIPAVWNDLVSDPPSALVELISACVEKNCGFTSEEQIRAFLLNYRKQFTVADQSVTEGSLYDPTSTAHLRPADQPVRQAKDDAIDAVKDESLERVEAVIKQKLERNKSRAKTADGRIGVYCTYSKKYIHFDFDYWFTITQEEMLKFGAAVDRYLVLACESAQNVLLIPLSDLDSLLPRLHRQKVDKRPGWDICIFNKDGKWLLKMERPEPPIDITRYLL